MGQTAVSVAVENSSPGAAGETFMVVETSRFGRVEVKRDAVISMVSPVLGFPDARRFFLKRHSERSPLMWFQSVEIADLAFVVIDPAFILADYQPRLKPAVLESLQAENQSCLDMLVILSIPPGGRGEVTANLMAPLVINAQARLASQVLLDSSGYDCRWPVQGPGGR